MVSTQNIIFSNRQGGGEGRLYFVSEIYPRGGGSREWRFVEIISEIFDFVSLPSTMATLLPPPKRQRSAYAQSLKPDPVPEPVVVPSVVVQFKGTEDGSNLGPSINLPADTGRDALQMLVNKLKGEDDPLPYSFHLRSATRVDINQSIMADALSLDFSPEDVFELWCEPQAVFRVRSVGRCSATLSGECSEGAELITGHASPILCCAHSPTGRYAATGSGDATCRIWDMETETPKVSMLSGHC